ncbi:hypothetical protein KJ359_001006 [Pestalotiopsis sp. 9143b]|nr:hypothetical protein KJ359_001006 [Pestalotiopsis sp. 9143b]
MVLGPSIFDEPPTVTEYGATVFTMNFDGVGSIGQNLNITENMFNTLNFSFLDNINGQLRIENNTNCKLLFNGTTSIASIYAANNPNTILPGWFPRPKQVNDVFLNGYINSSLESNIFPSLEIVANSIRLEPWNSDFDCASFLDRARTNGFGSPSCNLMTPGSDITAASAGPLATLPPPSSTDISGTASGGAPWTSTTTLQGLPSSSINTRTGAPSIKLSRVQWGIIGTGISVSFLICCFTAYYIWCLPAHKKWLWLRWEERRHGEGNGPEEVAGQTEQEVNVEGKEMPHEADGRQVVEAGGREVPHPPSELGNTAVIAEMWAPTTTLAELP